MASKIDHRPITGTATSSGPSRGTHNALLGGLLFLAGSGAYYVMPAYLSAAATQIGLDNRQVGLLSGAENLGIAIACLVVSLLVDRIGRRILLAAALISVAGDVVSGMVVNFPPLLALRFFTGLLGEGPCYAASFIVMGMTPNPDRTIGAGMTLIVVTASATLLGSPLLLAPFGAAGLLVPFAVAAVLLVPVLGWLPALDKSDSLLPVAKDSQGNGRAIWTLAAMGIWFAAPGLFWAFSGTAAAAHGFTDGAVNRALSISTVVGFVGSMLPVLIGNRAGRLLPIALTTAGLALSAWAYDRAAGLNGMVVALSLLNVFWNCSAVYQIAALTGFDRTGRFSGLGAVVQLIGLAIGPVLGGTLIDRFGYGIVPVVMAMFLLTGLALFAKALMRRSFAAERIRS